MNYRHAFINLIKKLSPIVCLIFITFRLAAQADECASFSNILTARITALGAIASNTGPYCLGENIQLFGSGGQSYFWTGPNGFTSSFQNPVINNGQFINAGNYYLTAYDTLGCSDMTSIKITFKVCVEDCDNGLDDDLDGLIDCTDETCKLDSFTINNSGDPVFCYENNTILTANQGASWLWSNGDTTNTITVFNSGNYKVTATNTQGCTAIDSISITVHPKPTATATVSGLSCVDQTIQFLASGGTGYHWTGPEGIEMHRADFDLTYLKKTQVGLYTAIVNNDFGCKDTAYISLNVGSNPVVSANGGMINCQNACVNLNATTSSSSVDFAWTGTSGFLNKNPITQVCSEGIYSLMATDTLTGCFSIDTALVFRNDTAFTLSCSASSMIDCEHDSIFIKIKPGIDNFHINLSGPNGYISHAQQSIVKQTGTYSAVVTSLISGCQVGCQVNIVESKTLPVAVAFAQNLTCALSEVQLICNASQPGVKYFWTGPGGFNSNIQNPMVYQKGMYHVQIKSTDNGCYSDMKEVEVEVD